MTLAITKTDGVASVVAGTSTTYTITATNSGPSQIPAGVVLSDPIPAGTVGSESEPDCSIAGRHVHVHDVRPDRRRRFGLVPVDARRRARLTRCRRSTNTASVTSSPATDTDPANDSATDTDTVTRRPTSSITKSDGVADVVAGTSTTYTIMVTNNGPSTEPAGVVLDDPIPGGHGREPSPNRTAYLAGSFTCTTTAPLVAGRLRSRTS